MAKLELFYKQGCPWCRKVMDYMDANGKTVDAMYDIYDGDGADEHVARRGPGAADEHRERLIEVGGKCQVPCLFIDGEPLYESSDIIDYLAENR